MTETRRSIVVAVHRDAGWAWLEIQAADVNAVMNRSLLRRIGRAQRHAGLRGTQVVISMQGDQPFSMATAINLIVLRRLLAVRDHTIVAILTEHNGLDPAVSHVADDLPLVGPEDHQHTFLSEVRTQALTLTDGWATVDHT